MDSTALSLAQELELEAGLRAIDACQDIDALRALSRRLHAALELQIAATRWAIRLGTASPSTS